MNFTRTHADETVKVLEMMNSEKMIVQVYVDTQDGVNRWLKENNHVKVVDIKMSANELGEIIMIIYNQVA